VQFVVFENFSTAHLFQIALLTLRYKHAVLNLQNMFRMINIHRQLRVQVNR